MMDKESTFESLNFPNENEGALSKRLSDLVSKKKLLEVILN